MANGLVAMALCSTLVGCNLWSRRPSAGDIASAANPLNWFGENAEPDAEPAAPQTPLLGSSPIGVVHMVDLANGFLLISASRATDVEAGTDLIAQNGQGRQTAELKLGPERKGQFLVADIVRGIPDVGDTVKLIGALDVGERRVTPVGAQEVQVLD